MKLGSDSSSSDRASHDDGLNLDLLVRPVASVPTSIGTLFLYNLRESDVSAIEDLTETEPIDRVRAYLPFVASLSKIQRFKEHRPPLTSDEVDRLPDSEIELIAETYSTLLLKRSAGGNDAEEKPQRRSSEDASAYLDRLLKSEIEDQHLQLGKARETVFASTRRIFDPVRESSSTLGSTISAFEQLVKGSIPKHVSVPNTDYFNPFPEPLVRQMRERAEELEMVRLTGKMTAESAKTLKALAEAATILLEQLNERDKKADKSTRNQITVAVWSVGISAFLASIALAVSSFAYYQDKTNNESSDRWQSELISAVRSGGEQRATAEAETQRLRDQVTVLEAKIARIDASQAAVSPSARGIALPSPTPTVQPGPAATQPR
jgi:hypothetical protein